MNTLVLLHGWGSSPRVFEGLRERLIDRCRVVTPALPGYDTPTAGYPYTLEYLVDIVSRIAPDRCFVAGWSLGALVALAWAFASPRQIERLVLVGATPCFVQRDGWHTGVDATVFSSFAQALEQGVDAALSRFAALQSKGEAEAQYVARTLRAARPHTVSRETLERGLDILRESDLREKLAAIVQRVLIVHGEHDAVSPRDAGAYLARAIPDAQFLELPDAGHAPFIAHADAVARAMREFLDA